MGEVGSLARAVDATRYGRDDMESKDVGIGAAVAVLLAVLGLIVFVGVILLMMWKQPGIEHSPSQQTSLSIPGRASHVKLESQCRCSALFAQYCSTIGREG